ncbi:Pyridoxine 5'-phosphate synthase [hydrothermal vent metagenome]|uniref:Pyridoxine 5'-phosphate synthase n=1 Tax=hydrothermal vent metagenome TaxID=652676 RepID=A0A3B1C392_9ZZZZ
MARLCVNVDHTATVRQARLIHYPDPLEAALLAEEAGAVGITVHLREDRRHIQDADVFKIRKAIHTKLNLEMAPVDEIIAIAHKVRPYQVTFVPEKRREVTTEGGLNVARGQKRLAGIVADFRKKKIVVSLFIDPDPEMVKAAAGIGAGAVEFNTGSYSEAGTKRDIARELKKIVAAAKTCDEMNIHAHAGHGLHLGNVAPVAAIGNIEELNIGHSIIGRAIMVGMKEAVTEMIAAMDTGAPPRS